MAMLVYQREKKGKMMMNHRVFKYGWHWGKHPKQPEISEIRIYVKNGPVCLGVLTQKQSRDMTAYEDQPGNELKGGE